MDRLGLLRLEAVDRRRRARAPRRRLAIDLAARPLGFVDDDRSQAGARQRFGGAHAGRPGADDDDDRLSQGVSFDDHGHAGLDQRRAGAHAAAVGEPDPAVLARRHQAEAGARAVAELEAPQRRRDAAGWR